MKDDTKTMELFKSYLKGDSLVFVNHFIYYCHLIDDIIDEQAIRNNPERVITAFEFAAMLYSNPFYLQHSQYLLPIIKMATNAYADSVAFESQPNNWNVKYKAVLAQQANDVALACIEIVCGQEARRCASLMLRELSYELHKNSF